MLIHHAHIKPYRTCMHAFSRSWHAFTLFNLGLLDIYGFEILLHNSIDQLFINYVNEKLQQLFIEKVLSNVQQVWYSILNDASIQYTCLRLCTSAATAVQHCAVTQYYATA